MTAAGQGGLCPAQEFFLRSERTAHGVRYGGFFFWPLLARPACGSLLRNVTLHPGSPRWSLCCEAGECTRGPRAFERSEKVWGGSAGALSLSGRFLFLAAFSQTSQCSFPYKKPFLLVPLGWAKFVGRSFFLPQCKFVEPSSLHSPGWAFLQKRKFFRLPLNRRHPF